MDRKLSALTIFILCISLFSCRKELVLSDDPGIRLSFSTDTVLFDTVFVSIGSTTQRLKVYNTSKNGVKISNIRLAGGSGSPYRLNIDGQPGTELSNYELAANDSMHIFVKVTINPSGEVLPFIVQDSIFFSTNGNLQKVQLAAYGQNANFYNDSVLPCNTVWDNALPHVIYNSVGVDSTCQLTIQKGAKVYFHKGSSLFVLGTLKVEGELHDSVTFQGDRREKIYFDQPGQWGGIHFLRGSVDNEINYAVIKNGIVGIRVDSLPVDGSTNPNLLLTNSVIKNMSAAGFLGYTARLAAFNSLFFTCGQYAILGAYGGDYLLKHCTIGNYSIFGTRNTPSVTFADNYGDGSPTADLTVNLLNNIIWGDKEDEFQISKKGNTNIAIGFANNLIRTSNQSYAGFGNILNKDPLFKKYQSEDYHLTDTNSPAYQKGTIVTGDPLLIKDLDGNSRNTEKPSIGCYEIIEP